MTALAAPWSPACPSCMQSPVFLQWVTTHRVCGGSERLLLPWCNLFPSSCQHQGWRWGGRSGELYRRPPTLPTHLLNVEAATVSAVGRGPRQVPCWLGSPPSTPRHPAPWGWPSPAATWVSDSSQPPSPPPPLSIHWGIIYPDNSNCLHGPFPLPSTYPNKGNHPDMKGKIKLPQ